MKAKDQSSNLRIVTATTTDQKRRKSIRDTLHNWKPADNLQDLWSEYDAACAADEALVGVLNRPRCTGANEAIGGWMEVFSWIKTEVVEQAKKIEATNASEAEIKAELIIRQQIHCGLDDPMEFAGDFSKLLLDIARFEMERMRKAS